MFSLLLLAACADTPAPEPLTPKIAVQMALQDQLTRPNEAASGRTLPAITDPVLYDHVERSVALHVNAWAVFKRLEETTPHYATVVTALREANLPEVLAGVPYAESRYQGSARSTMCAAGWWQFMPEVAVRQGLQLDGCQIDGKEGPWTPTRASPGPIKELPYRVQGQCGLTCATDERSDLAKSTAAAVAMFEEPWANPTLRASGALVQITIASHNAGYDDGLYGNESKPFNVLPAFRTWSAGKTADEHPTFIGDNIRTSTPADDDWGGSELPAETQHYVYTTVAEHLVAMCYYGQNHADLPAFAPWKVHSEPDGFCSAWRIPSRAEVLAHE